MSDAVDIERIRRVLLDEDVLAHLAHAHTVYEADEEHGGIADEEEGEETFQRAADLEYVLNWLHPNYISPSFTTEYIAQWRAKNAAVKT